MFLYSFDLNIRRSRVCAQRRLFINILGQLIKFVLPANKLLWLRSDIQHRKLKTQTTNPTDNSNSSLTLKTHILPATNHVGVVIKIQIFIVFGRCRFESRQEKRLYQITCSVVSRSSSRNLVRDRF